MLAVTKITANTAKTRLTFLSQELNNDLGFPSLRTVFGSVECPAGTDVAALAQTLDASKYVIYDIVEGLGNVKLK